MPDSYRIVECNDNEIWNQTLDRFPTNIKDVFYTEKYYLAFENNGLGKAKCFIFEFQNNFAIYPFLVNAINILGYDLDTKYFDIQGAYGYNGVISTTTDLKFREHFFRVFAKYCVEMNIVAEFTRFHPIINNHHFNLDFTDVIKDRQTVFLDLTMNYDEIWTKQYSSNNRNMIRKAKQRNLTVQEIISFTTKKVEEFTSVYSNAMIAIGADKYYLFSLTFFQDIFHNLNDHLVLFEVIDEEGRLNNIAIILIHSKKATYYFSARNEWADNSSNNFLLDNAIKYAKNMGAKTFYLGGGNSSNLSDPLLKFKSNFSNRKTDFFIGKKIHNQKIYDEVIRQWEEKYPDLVPKYQNQLLRYRNIK
jgi:hypothetical protein